MKTVSEESLPISIANVMGKLEDKVRRGAIPGQRAFSTGFPALDRRIAGGIRQGDLLLLGGAEGAGKTTFAFQLARNIASARECIVLYLCYEHSEEDLLLRLLSMESAVQGPLGDVEGLRLTDMRARLWQASGTPGGLEGALLQDVQGRRALQRLNEYSDHFRVMKASASLTDTDSIREIVEETRRQTGQDILVVVDYLQKVPLHLPNATEDERIGRITENLKELALSLAVPVIAIVAADKQGIQARRLRSYHLRGSSSLLYEADVILIMNEKNRIVSRQAVNVTAVKDAQMANWVVFSIEKNRAGRDLVDFQLRKLFAYGLFDPSGDAVPEPLVDERIYTD